jgi:hypothetical protein
MVNNVWKKIYFKILAIVLLSSVFRRRLLFDFETMLY